MKVEVRSRSFHPTIGAGGVLRVSSRLESISPVFRRIGNNSTAELGLPVPISPPCALKLIPSEIVDLRLNPERRGSVPR